VPRCDPQSSDLLVGYGGAAIPMMSWLTDERSETSARQLCPAELLAR
jgi:hypothetical protein